MEGLINYGVFMAIFMAIYAVSTIGLNIHWGQTGLFNAGIAGFFSVGAYTSAIATGPAADGRLGGFELPVVAGWLLAMLASLLAAWPIGKICLKFRSDYLAIASIGIAEMIRLVLKSEDWLSNGVRGINHIPRPFGELAYLPSQLAYLGLVLVVLIIVYRLAEWQTASPWGRMMRAVRDNEVAAAAMGKDIEWRRLQAFLYGAALMGLSGALYAHFNRVMTVDAVDPMIATFLVWIMLIVGGSGNHRGAILGTIVVWTIWSATEILTDQLPADYALKAKYLRIFLIGLILQIVLKFRPQGLLPERNAR